MCHYFFVAINVGDSTEIVKIVVTKYTKGFTDIVSKSGGGKSSDKYSRRESTTVLNGQPRVYLVTMSTKSWIKTLIVMPFRLV